MVNHVPRNSAYLYVRAVILLAAAMLARSVAATRPLPPALVFFHDVRAMEDRASRYRNIAAEVRASAEAMPDDWARQQMMRAAEVWERLAALEERLVLASFERLPPLSIR